MPSSLAMAQQAVPQSQSATGMETKEAPAKFTSRVNLVPVRVIVRDRDVENASLSRHFIRQTCAGFRPAPTRRSGVVGA